MLLRWQKVLLVHAVQHLAFEDLGGLANVLVDRELVVRTIDATRGDFGAARESDLVIILGGPISANDSVRFPFLTAECAMIEHRLKRGLPTLGICLGAQLMAQVLGAKIYPMAQKEIGFSPLELTAAGKDHPLANISAPVLHWHGETFNLPYGAARLASTALCTEQAFAVDDHSLALQFHLEVRARELERWLVGHIVELEAAGIDPSTLRAQAKHCSRRIERDAHDVFHTWLDRLGYGKRNVTRT